MIGHDKKKILIKIIASSPHSENLKTKNNKFPLENQNRTRTPMDSVTVFKDSLSIINYHLYP